MSTNEGGTDKRPREEEPDAPAKRPRIAESDLSDEQRNALERALRGESMFITGNAGTGKTALMNVLYAALCQLHGSTPEIPTVSITATTGIAACQSEGASTINSFFGFGIEKDTVKIKRRIVGGRHVARLKAHRVIFIDEAGMLSAEVLTGINQALQQIFGSKAPFGGVQMILVGDLLQLGVIDGKPIFNSPAWPHFRASPVYLERVFRQSDREFVDLLSRARTRDVTAADIAYLNARVDPQVGDDAVRIFPYRKDVAEYNTRRLRALPGPTRVFGAVDTMHWRTPKKQKDLPPPEDMSSLQTTLEKLLRVEKSVELAVGARVILRVNIDVPRGLVNGRAGTVESILSVDGEHAPLVHFDHGVHFLCAPCDTESTMPHGGGVVALVRKQVPLQQGWAISAHGSQGMTLDKIAADVAPSFGSGMAYVILSRAATPAGISLYRRVSAATFKLDPRTREEDRELLANARLARGSV